MKDTANSEESVVVECDLPEPPEKVWRALTERKLLAQWLTPGDGPVEYKILEAEPNRKLRWRQSERDESNADWVDSVVTIDLFAIPGGGTHLRVVHDEFEARPATCSLAEFRMAA
jgi:uncharacterized protein YndB with AHSA1/START domain